MPAILALALAGRRFQPGDRDGSQARAPGVTPAVVSSPAGPIVSGYQRTKCVTTCGGSDASGALVVVGDRDGSAGQDWTVGEPERLGDQLSGRWRPGRRSRTARSRRAGRSRDTVIWPVRLTDRLAWPSAVLTVKYNQCADRQVEVACRQCRRREIGEHIVARSRLIDRAAQVNDAVLDAVTRVPGAELAIG